MNRRHFIEFLGWTFAMTACANPSKSSVKLSKSSSDLVLHPKLKYQTLLKWGDPIGQGMEFGFNCDFNCFIPTGQDKGILWTNHEYINPNIFHRFAVKDMNSKTKAQVEKEMKAVGGSFVSIEKIDGTWKPKLNSKYNRRISALTPIPFSKNEMVQGSNTAIGTMGNCSGGYTPWGTILTCEENFADFFAETNTYTGKVNKSWMKWEKHFDHPTEHYGWVVEINPITGTAEKHTSMGRMAHECATVTTSNSGEVVVYTGDDKNGGCLYKMVSDSRNTLSSGTLYVANMEKGKWEPLNLTHPNLKDKFKSNQEILIFAREAALLAGGTPLDRPEDIEIFPNKKGEVLIALTNNKKKKNFYGSLLKVSEKNDDPTSLSFSHSTYMMGGPELGFACPDNMAFDPKGNLWITTDISESSINKEPYQFHGNNGLFVVKKEGPMQGIPQRVATAPNDAELTGPWFTQDGKNLFLSVQHPGTKSKSPTELTTGWPTGSYPQPSVVVIEGVDKI